MWVALSVAALLAICLVSAVARGNAPDRGAPARDAKRVCQDFVKKRLKAPSTAEFVDLEVSESAGDYTVAGNVDAQNSFGAQLRSAFTCVVHDDGDEWRLVSIDGLN